MPLPIAVGGVSLSSERLEGPHRSGVSTSTHTKDPLGVSPRPQPYQSVSWAVCPHHEWQARVVLSFYDETEDKYERNGPQQQQPQHRRKRKRMAEVRVQISPLARALSKTAYRETRYQFLAYENETTDGDEETDNNTTNDDDDDAVSSSSSESDDASVSSGSLESRENSTRQPSPRETHHRQPQIIFTHDRRHLVVLLFCNDPFRSRQSSKSPTQNGADKSAMVVFQLRKPRSDSIAYSSSNDRSKIPLPSYLARTAPSATAGGGGSAPEPAPGHASYNSSGGSPVVATNPRLMHWEEGVTVTAVCGLPSAAAGGDVFVAAGTRGILHWIHAKSMRIAATASLALLASNSRVSVASVTASPGCGATKGTLALVLAASKNFSSAPEEGSSRSSDEEDYDNESETDASSNEDGSGSSSRGHDPEVRAGDCLLIDWTMSLSSSLPPESTHSQSHSGVPDASETSYETHVDENGTFGAIPKHSPASSQPKQNLRPKLPFVEPGRASVLIHTQLRSVWTPPSIGSDHELLRVASVCFGCIPSVLCVVYDQHHGSDQQRSTEPRQKMAQVLTLLPSGSSDSGIRNLIPTASLYLSSEQVEQAPSVAHKNTHTAYEPHYQEDDDSSSTRDEEYTNYETTSEDEFSADEESSYEEIPPIESRMIGIQHDPGSDSFVVSSIFRGNRSAQKDYWVGCVWNWRANAIGWMIQRELTLLPRAFIGQLGNKMAHCNDDDGISWSRLYVGRDTYNGGGQRLVHIDSSLRYKYSSNYNGNAVDFDGNSTILQSSKRIVPVALLSPSNSIYSGGFTERSTLLLAEKHISFPSVSTKNSDAAVRELDWKISALPLSYVASHGCPKIAAMGPTRAKSIAVASARGVCVLDTRHNKWRQFGSPSEERSFFIVSMAWWEGSPGGTLDDERDDLLVAITQTSSGDQFLSCWCSKRLDLMHQLMDTPDLEWKPGESQDPEPSWGIPLSKNAKMTNISIISEPELEKEEGDNCHRKPRRAIALVYSSDPKTIECNFMVFRLQVFRNKTPSSHSSEPYVVKRPFYVMAHKPAQDMMNYKISSMMNYEISSVPVTSAFIASASFQYDLRQLNRRKSVRKMVVEVEEEDFIATLGVACSPGGVHAISIFKNGDCVACISKFEVSRYQVSDRMLSGVLSSDKRNPIVKFTWTFELLNGNIICWSVPSIVGSQSDRFDSLEVDFSSVEETQNNLPETKRPKGLDPPSPICKRNASGNNERWILGSICEVGTVSDWATQSTFGCQFDISLGQVPQSVFGCVLRSGQNVQRFGRGNIEGIDSRNFPSNILEMKSYSQSPFMITPPAFVIPLYALLLEGAFLQTKLDTVKPSISVENLKNRLKTIKSQIQHRFVSVRNTDSLMMALRLITFRSLEMIAKMHSRHLKKPSENTEADLLLSKGLLSVIVDATHRCMSDLQFASLFLEVGRQTEPSNLQHLFPLPLLDKPAESRRGRGSTEAGSVIDLFTTCIDKGSLAASASALPLLTSKVQARYYCGLLLEEAIDNFLKNAAPDQCGFDRTEEERRVLGDFFRFGMKLEDAELYEENQVIEREEERMSSSGTSANTLERSASNLSFAPESPENKRRLICNLTADNSILNYIVPSSMRGESEKQRIEDAIRREATSFINKSLDDPCLDFAMLPDWNNSFSSHDTNRDNNNSVAHLVGDALLDLLQADHMNNKWKIVAAFARMILRDGVRIPSSFSTIVEVAENAQPLDLLPFIPESYGVDNGLEQNICSYIKDGIRKSARQLTVTDANHIVDMSLLLLDRVRSLPLVDVDDQKATELGLVFIIMIAGDTCERSSSIQEIMNRDSILCDCYKQATGH